MRKLSRPAHTVGHPPGTLTVDHGGATQGISVRLLEYDTSSVEERVLDRVEDAFASAAGKRCTWIDIDGVRDVAVLRSLGTHFDLHPLLLEDIANVVQRSKVEAYEGKTYIVVRLPELDETSEEIESRQISLVLVGNTLVTFHEHSSDVFEEVRRRIRSGRPGIRNSDAPYLAYALLDAVVDRHFVLLERLGEHMENLDEALLANPRPETLDAIHRLKRELIYLRKSVWPLREAIDTMLRDEDLPFHDHLHLYLRDLRDHATQVMETIDSYRELVAGMLDTYLSMTSHRLNEVMKTLTVIATLFIPLTFVVGVYGMNFEHMPELRWRWAYPALWGAMIGVAGIMLAYFRRRGWF